MAGCDRVRSAEIPAGLPNMVARSFFILALLSLNMLSAYAQRGAGIELLGGLYKTQNVDGPRPLGGIALRFRVSELIGMEASVNYREEEYGGGSIAVRSWPVMVTGLYYPVAPLYLAAGAGWYTTSVHLDDSRVSPGNLAALAGETRRQFGGQIGAGVELPVFSFVQIVGDVRYVITNHRFDPLSGGNGISGNSPVLTAGLLFGF